MKKRLSILVVVCLLASLVLSACGNGAAPGSSPSGVPSPSGEPSPAAEDHAPVTIMVAAAASLENVYVNELLPMFKAEYPWITVEGTYDSSGKLQTQIEEGLAADVFMSAATKQMSALTEKGMIDGASVVELLENEIVLITPSASNTSIASFEDIVNAATVAIGDPASVPAGQYAQEALTALGVWDAIQPKTSLGTNVTEVLNAVAEGSADVGIVYATDAAQMLDRVKILAKAPEGSLKSKVIYPVGILSISKNREAAELFVKFLNTPAAISVFVANGFKANA